MKDTELKNSSEVYEKKYESCDFSFEFRFEYPKLPEKTPKKIHGFYEKKLKRSNAYYRDAFLRCAKKHSVKQRGGYDFPDAIIVSHKITDNSGRYISVLRKTEFFYSGRSAYVVFSEVWSLPDCRLLFMGDLSGGTYVTEKRISAGTYRLCMDDIRFEPHRSLRARLRRNLHRENVYIKNSTAYIFFQPGVIAPEKYGIISFPLDAAIKACPISRRNKTKKPQKQA